MIFLIIPIIVIYLLPLEEEKIKFMLLIVPFSILILIRYGIGADYFAYSYLYELTNVNTVYEALTVQPKFEPLIKALFYWSSEIGLSYIAGINLFSSLLFLFFVIWIYRNSSNKVLSLILFLSMFYYVWALSALRQAVPLIIGLYLFYDKRDFKLSTQLIWIIIGSLFHSSSYFLLIILAFNKIYFKKKHVLILVFISIMISFLPLHSIIENLKFLPFQDKILQYTRPGIGVFSFGYIVRFIFTITFIVIYDIVATKNVYLINNILFGFSIYFLFSFSPIVAGRLAIFSYVPIVLLLPEIAQTFNNKRIANGLIFVFSLLYFSKETFALIEQSGMRSVMDMPIISDVNKYKFNKYEYYLLSKRDKSTKLTENFIKSVDDKKYVGYSEEQYNFVVWNANIHGYLIYDTNGNLSIQYPMRGNPRLYKDVLVNDYDMGGLYMEEKYIDLSGKGRSKNEMINYIAEYETMNRLISNVDQELLDIEFESLPKITKEVFLFPNNVRDVKIYKLKEPSEYHIMEARYYYDVVYVILDNNLNPLNDLLFDSISKFDITETAEARYYGKKIHLNKNGEIIWIGG